MIIGLDFDNTFTADPELWTQFIRSCKVRGHLVNIVTMRYGYQTDMYTSHYTDEHTEVFKALDGLPIERFVFTGRMAKKVFCEKNDVHIDIWIDDKPEWLFTDG